MDGGYSDIDDDIPFFDYDDLFNDVTASPEQLVTDTLTDTTSTTNFTEKSSQKKGSKSKSILFERGLLAEVYTDSDTKKQILCTICKWV